LSAQAASDALYASRAHAHKCLAGKLQTPAAKQLRERVGRVPLPLAGKQDKRGEHGLRLLEAHVDLPAETAVPPESRTRVALRRLVARQEAELDVPTEMVERAEPPA
jgi:hypothetical protein